MRVEVPHKYHSTLIKLYIDFDKLKLMRFLKQTELFEYKSLLKLFQRHGLFAEQALILFKANEREQAMDIMRKNCTQNLGDVIEICKLYEVPEEDIWNPLLADAKRDNSKMP